MAAMTIRKLSEAATANIKLSAKANGRSAEAEARFALEKQFATPKVFKSALQVIEEFKLQNGGGFVLPHIDRNMDSIEPADFE